MDSQLVDLPKGGFVYDNCRRNENLCKLSDLPFKMTKTGTTLAAVIFDGGIVLGADTRTTEGSIISSGCCEKIHYIADNIYCCGAGTAADTQQVTRMVSSQIELHRLNTGRKPRVIAALRLLKQHLFKYKGHIGAACILGGVDNFGPHLYGVYPHGSSDKVPYTTMGSGSLASMAILETKYRPDLNREDAMELVRQAILAGVFNDLYSGTGVDLCVITSKGTEYLRRYDVSNVKGVRARSYLPKPGTTKCTKSEVKRIEYEVVSTRVIRDMEEREPMVM
ncbi:proteasome subunit beta type 7 [Echinococcus multilocularis]|uniref:Proteasome subunit beta n=1 Tax=Echinococcus multilocularis TaxID=6211 RepID=A0A087VXI5_ECHMU|nr:proteasome subunit beta type 7 [Echinococcus multilocularis]